MPFIHINRTEPCITQWLKKTWCLKWPRTNKFNLYFLKYLHRGWKMFWIFNALKRLRTNKFNFYFLKVSNYLRHGWRKFLIWKLWNGLERITSTSIFSKYFHHGWRKFWILMLWNGLERTNSTSIFSKCQIIFTMVEESFEFKSFETS